MILNHKKNWSVEKALIEICINNFTLVCQFFFSGHLPITGIDPYPPFFDLVEDDI